MPAVRYPTNPRFLDAGEQIQKPEANLSLSDHSYQTAKPEPRFNYRMHRPPRFRTRYNSNSTTPRVAHPHFFVMIPSTTHTPK